MLFRSLQALLAAPVVFISKIKFLLVLLLAPVASLELELFWAYSLFWSRYCYFFMFFQACLLEVLLPLRRNKFSSFGASTCVFSTKSSWEYWIERADDLVIVQFASWFSYKQWWSILCKIDYGCKLAFILILVVFLIKFSQLSFF